jgi:hypothetical protein
MGEKVERPLTTEAPREAAVLEGRSPSSARYVLITQCLQNDLFLDPECRVFVGDDAVRRLLVAKRDYESYKPDGNPRRIPARLLEHGPLGLFLKACIGERLTGKQSGVLHVINIRDWHVTDDSYDAERRLYGRHCEAGTWGARYIDGLARYLDPEAPRADGRAAFCGRGTARIYHVHADSIFDFRPRWEERNANHGKFHPSSLERLLDVLLTGSDELVDTLAQALANDVEIEAHESGKAARRQSQALNQLALRAVRSNIAAETSQLYVAVIGVYTDIKVQILLAGMRARYEIPNLAVSDTLTASKSFERHLNGLDNADKLLGVEVIHGLGDLCCFLGTEPPVQDETDIVGAENYAYYRTFFADKQTVLAYETEKLQEYARLTERRSIAVFNTVQRANTFLLIWGSAFLTLTLIGSVLHAVEPKRWSWQLLAITGGIGLIQLVAAFFSRPIRDLQQNLNNLAGFRMVLEGHSLKTAFTRYHLTTPEVLRELKNRQEVSRAQAQINALESQLAVIDRFQTSDYQALETVSFSSGDGDGRKPNSAAAQPTETATTETQEDSATDT